MTEYRYEDRAGAIKQAEEIWEMKRVVPNPKINQQMFGECIAQKEEEIKQRLSANGGTLLSINTLLISKRRYKRKAAKEMVRNSKMTSTGEGWV